MNIRMLIKLIVLGSLIVMAGHCLKGHDVLTGIALTALFLVVSAKLVFAFIHRRGPGPGNGPVCPPYAPIAIPPSGRPKPPVLSATNRI